MANEPGAVGGNPVSRHSRTSYTLFLGLPTPALVCGTSPGCWGSGPRSQRRKWSLIERPEVSRDCCNNSNISRLSAQQVQSPYQSAQLPCAPGAALAVSGLGPFAHSPHSVLRQARGFKEHSYSTDSQICVSSQDSLVPQLQRPAPVCPGLSNGD